MLKLRKILNKHNNAPEIELFDVAYDVICDGNAVLYLVSNELYTQPENAERPILYMVLDSVDDRQTDRKVRCYRITPEMIFETNGIGTHINNGARFKLSRNNDNYAYDNIEIVEPSETSSDGNVVDASNFKYTGKILVRFHCKQ